MKSPRVSSLLSMKSPRRVSSMSALKMSFENEIGALPPLFFFDPLGLLVDADQDRFDRLRYVEMKHGRIGKKLLSIIIINSIIITITIIIYYRYVSNIRAFSNILWNSY